MFLKGAQKLLTIKEGETKKLILVPHVAQIMKKNQLQIKPKDSFTTKPLLLF